MTLIDHTDAETSATAEWWRDAVVYQVYLRSFKDGNGDGIGDLSGLRDGLPSIADLGCDAVWLNPCYNSPQRDHGYDIADYRSIDPAYGTLHEFDEMVREAHRLGLRVIMDMVANHCSTEHAWFQEAIRSAPDSAARDRFLFHDGRGEDGNLPPNNWQSVFGGSAWTRVTETDGTAGQWYLHSFDSGQPDFNWRNPEVADEFDDILRFWFDRGVDGFRIDVAHGHVKAVGLPDWPGADDGTGGHNEAMWDQPEVHDIFRGWRAIADQDPPGHYLVGEVWVPTADRLASYLRPDEMHQAFTFDLLIQPWSAPHLRDAIDTGLRLSPTGHPAWTLSNHDVHRAVSRYGQDQVLSAPSSADKIAAARRTGEVDVIRGERRARAAAALMLALPGTPYLYQGEELGLPEVFDLPAEARQDPIWIRSGGKELGRDGCRVPLPWRSGAPAFGFSGVEHISTWLPQPEWFARYARREQEEDRTSTLHTYMALIAARRELFPVESPLEWWDTGRDDVIAFSRGSAVCVTNFDASKPFSIPDAWPVLTPVVCTSPSTDGVAPDSTAWFRA